MGENIDFLEIHKSSMETLGFWSETYKSTAKLMIENSYLPEITKIWYVSDIVINNDKILIHWSKRLHPLTDEELKLKHNNNGI